MVTSYRVIGRPEPRVDGFDKVTGHARYAADINLPGTIWGKTLSCPYPHARIVRIDTSAAKALPGVHAVITGADTRDGGLWGRGVKDAPTLAYDVVRYAGERVAAVAADDEDIRWCSTRSRRWKRTRRFCTPTSTPTSASA
jgi:CO/xanthine dehydrogenase Mo-binding subunit